MEPKFVIEPEKQRFCLVLSDDSRCMIEYKIQNGIFILYHTETPDQHQGQGLAGKLSKLVFDYLIENKIKFYPTCSYLVHYCEKNKIEYK
jgi:uncharacterized protein